MQNIPPHYTIQLTKWTWGNYGTFRLIIWWDSTSFLRRRGSRWPGKAKHAKSPPQGVQNRPIQRGGHIHLSRLPGEFCLVGAVSSYMVQRGPWPGQGIQDSLINTPGRWESTAYPVHQNTTQSLVWCGQNISVQTLRDKRRQSVTQLTHLTFTMRMYS